MAPAKKLFSFSVPSDSVEELRLIAKVYLEEKLEKSYLMENINKVKKNELNKEIDIDNDSFTLIDELKTNSKCKINNQFNDFDKNYDEESKSV